MQALFRTCYRLQAVGLGGVLWTRVALPSDGGAGEQPARVMSALDLIEVVANQELQRMRTPREATA